MVPGKRYTVFAIRRQKNGSTVWVRAGVAFVQPDDSMNVTLDVLPLDGGLHIREVGEAVSDPKPDTTGEEQQP